MARLSDKIMTNTIADKLAYLEETKGLIKEAIIAKGGTVSDEDTFRSYASKIEAIQSGGSIAGAPSGIRFSNSTFTTVPTEIIPYLEQQTDLSGIFMQCNSLTTVPLFDTSRVTTMENMFNGCSSLASVASFNTHNVTDMHYMFPYCMALKSAPKLDTSKVNNMNGMFSHCTSLKSVPLLDISKVDMMSYIFSECSSLTNLGGFTGLKMDLDLSSSPLLTTDSVMNVINNAADMTSNPQTLTLHQDVFNKLSQDQIANSGTKGWNIAAA